MPLSAVPSKCFHGSLHLIGEVSQPVLNVSFSHNGIKKLNIFSESSKFHVDFVNVRVFVFFEGYGGDTSVKFLEIVLELLLHMHKFLTLKVVFEFEFNYTIKT